MSDDYFSRLDSYSPIRPTPDYGSGASYLASPSDYEGVPSEKSVGVLSLEGMLGAKIQRTEDRIEAVIEAIDKRRLIKEENLYGIERDICTCQNLIFEMGYKVYRRDRDWIGLETRKIDLERDRRMELAAYFRDILFLGKELRDTVEYRRSIKDKAKLLGGKT